MYHMIHYNIDYIDTNDISYYVQSINTILLEIKEYYDTLLKFTTDRYLLEYYDLSRVSESDLIERTTILRDTKSVSIYLKVLVTNIDSIAFIVYKNSTFKLMYNNIYFISSKHFQAIIKNSNVKPALITRIAYYYYIKYCVDVKADVLLLTETVFNTLFGKPALYLNLKIDTIENYTISEVVYHINNFIIEILEYYCTTNSGIYIIDYNNCSTMSEHLLDKKIFKINVYSRRLTRIYTKLISTKIDTLMIIYIRYAPVVMQDNVYLINPMHYKRLISNNKESILIQYAYAYCIYCLIHKIADFDLNIPTYINLFYIEN